MPSIVGCEGRIECPKFGHSALSSKFKNYELNTEFVTAVGMQYKNIFPCESLDFNLSSKL